jgi:MFS family permease
VITLRQFRQRTFASFSVHNYRLYFFGQSISMSGNWMQIIGQDLLVLELTGSGTRLGIVTALQTLPVLIFGSFAGVIVDRYPKRNILYVTQTLLGLLALTLGTLVATGAVEMWMIYIIATCLGCVTMVDNPTRQAFVHEMVGRDLLANAISLNSTEINMARVIGPSIAGILVTLVGLSACFFINGVSYIAVLLMLFRMNASELHAGPLAGRAKGQLMAGFRYVRSTPTLWVPLLMMAIIGMLSYEFRVVLPLFATFTFDGDASTYAALTSAMGVGAVIGGGYTASRRKTTMPMLVISAALFGCSILLAAIAPNVPLALAALVVVGFFSINYTSLGNTTLQLESSPEMRGRVMSLWTVAFMGSTPIGGPIIGAVGEHFGARWSLTVGGLAALFAAGVGALVLQRMRKQVSERPVSQ